MFRWIIVLGLGALTIAFVLFTRNTIKVAYVNGLAPYTQLPGQEYFFERDCYIFKLKDHPTDWPLVGSQVTVAALPAVVEPKNVRADLPGVRILDIVKVGERFKIASVRRDQQGDRTRITFELLLTDESVHPYPRIDAYWIMDHTPEARGQAPAILTTYAVSRYIR
jgi:hypothetical protein